MTDTDRMLAWLREALDAAEQIAQATTPVPVAGQWAAVRDKHADEDAPLSLIQGQDPHEPGYKGYSSGVPIIAISGDWPEAEANLRHIVRHDPAAVLRRIAADRQLLELHDQAHECVSYDWVSKDINTCMWIDAGETCTTMRLLAEGWGWTEEEQR